MKRQLQIKDSIAQAEWTGDCSIPIAPDETWLFVDVTGRPNARVGMTYDAQTDTFTETPAAARRFITRHEFLSRFTVDEEIALEMIAVSTAPEMAQTAAGIRVFQRRLLAAQVIDLDHADVVTGLTNVKTILMNANVWATAEIADARIDALRASA